MVPRLPGCTAWLQRSGSRGLDTPLLHVAVLLFTRDLRVHDNPALVAAVEEAETVLPLFVLDEGIGGRASGRRQPSRVPRPSRSPISTGRCGGSAEPSTSVAARSSRRRSRAAREVGATTVFATADVSPYAAARAPARGGARSPPRRRPLRRPAGRGDPDRQRPLPGLLAVLPRLVARTDGIATARAEGDPPASAVREGFVLIQHKLPSRALWRHRTLC